MLKQITETTDFIQNKTSSFNPEFGIILGSGLGSFVDEIEVLFELNYSEIPNFPVSTIEGHSGKLIFGTIEKKKVVAMNGRFHYYEGYEMHEVTFPVRVMKALGVQLLIVSNASGGVNSSFKVGDVMIINDHINLLPAHPLRGKNYPQLGPRFVNMSEPYSNKYIKKAEYIGLENDLDLKKGVYLALQGPTFETLAEYKMVKILGADCVGMSTVPEVIVARHMDLECFGVSVITDMGSEDGIQEVNHEEVLLAAKSAEPKLKVLIKKLILD